MIKIKSKKISSKELKGHLDKLNKNGYTIVRNFFSKNTIEQLLKLTNQKFKLQNKEKKKIKTPKVWNKADIIYNLQNKDINYIKILQNKFFEDICISKLNDPHYRSSKKNIPNYILNNYIARSSGKGSLFLHIDSGIPTGDVTTFIQIMIPLERTVRENGCTVVVPKSHLSKKYCDRSTKKFDYIEGDPGDIFIWDGNLWHGSLPNQLTTSRWSLIITFCNWQFKQVFDIPRGLPKNIFNKINDKEKMLLGFCGIPSVNEHERIPRSISIKDLKKNKNQIYKLI